MCQLIACTEINNMNDLRFEISRRIWQQEDEFNEEMILNKVKETDIKIDGCDDNLILNTIRLIIKSFMSTNHLIVDKNNGTFVYL